MGASGRICAERKRRQTGAPLRHRPYPHERDLIMNLEGKTAFITGGGGGIGNGMAQAFAERGMKLVPADIDPARERDTATAFGEDATAVEPAVTASASWAESGRGIGRAYVREHVGRRGGEWGGA